MKNNKNIFSTMRITRLVFTAWLISLALTFIITSLLGKIIPHFTSLHYIIIALIFFGISTIIGATIFYFLTKKTNELTSEINNTIDRISQGDFSARLNFNPVNQDIDNVVDNFNKMAKELNSLAVLNEEFVSNFSHEFKTPIVSIKGYAELLSASTTLSDEEKQYLNIIIDESNRLASLSDNAMTLCKLDSNRVEREKEIFWLDEELNRCILLFDSRLTAKNLQFDADVDRFKICADKNLVKEIWINLISNAVKFTPENGIVKMSAKEYGNFAFITVSDTGMGLDEKNVDDIFNRNYRGKNAQNFGGKGIGLAITKRIVELHGGSIHAENCIGGGAQFVVKLPLNLPY